MKALIQGAGISGLAACSTSAAGTSPSWSPRRPGHAHRRHRDRGRPRARLRRALVRAPQSPVRSGQRVRAGSRLPGRWWPLPRAGHRRPVGRGCVPLGREGRAVRDVRGRRRLGRRLRRGTLRAGAARGPCSLDRGDRAPQRPARQRGGRGGGRDPLHRPGGPVGRAALAPRRNAVDGRCRPTPSRSSRGRALPSRSPGRSRSAMRSTRQRVSTTGSRPTSRPGAERSSRCRGARDVPRRPSSPARNWGCGCGGSASGRPGCRSSPSSSGGSPVARRPTPVPRRS